MLDLCWLPVPINLLCAECDVASCDIYVEFEQEFKLEQYLLFENQKYRQAVCNLRVNNTRTPEVSGRYEGLDRKQRTCNVCEDSRFGEEYHV